jgi:hypothetical protein
MTYHGISKILAIIFTAFNPVIVVILVQNSNIRTPHHFQETLSVSISISGLDNLHIGSLLLLVMWWCHDFGKRLEVAIEEVTRNQSAYAIKRKNVVVQFNLGPAEILRDDRNRFFICNNFFLVFLLRFVVFTRFFRVLPCNRSSHYIIDILAVGDFGGAADLEWKETCGFVDASHQPYDS